MACGPLLARHVRWYAGWWGGRVVGAPAKSDRPLPSTSRMWHGSSIDRRATSAGIPFSTSGSKLSGKRNAALANAFCGQPPPLFRALHITSPRCLLPSDPGSCSRLPSAELPRCRVLTTECVQCREQSAHDMHAMFNMHAMISAHSNVCTTCEHVRAGRARSGM